MLVIEGTYENEQVILDHKQQMENKTKVIVIFEESDTSKKVLEKRPFGIHKEASHSAQT